MKASEFRKKTKEELDELLQEKRARIEELKFLLRQKKVKNIQELSGEKKDVERILTLLKSLN